VDRNLLPLAVIAVALTLCVDAARADFKSFILGDAPSAHSAEDGMLDRVSRSCLGCHDGARAKYVGIETRDTVAGAGFGRRNHPVGIHYDAAVARDPGGLNPRATLHPAIQLVDGRLSCVSCHEQKTEPVRVASTEAIQPADLCTSTKNKVLGPGDRQLCLACHVK